MTLQALVTLKAFRSASKLICCTNSFGEQSHSDLKLLVLYSECVSRLKKSEAPKTFSERVLRFFSSVKLLAVLWTDYWEGNKKHSVLKTNKNKTITPQIVMLLVKGLKLWFNIIKVFIIEVTWSCWSSFELVV